MSELFVAFITGGFSPNQPCTVAFVLAVYVDLSIGERGGTLKESANEAMLGIVISTKNRPPICRF